MKLTKQRLKEIIKEELSILKEEPTREEQSVLAASKKFIQYLKSQGLSDMSHPTIKKHLIDLGLPPSVAGQYALFSAQTFKTPERMVDDEYEEKYPQEYDELEEGWGWREEDSDLPMTNREKMDQIARLTKKKKKT